MTAAALELAIGASLVEGRHTPTARDTPAQSATMASIHRFVLGSAPGTIIIMDRKKKKSNVVTIATIQNKVGRSAFTLRRSVQPLDLTC